MLALAPVIKSKNLKTENKIHKKQEHEQQQIFIPRYCLKKVKQKKGVMASTTAAV